ncbi:MAG: hypothetical protein H3C27_09750 [Opitutaceae bacterium]|nr:hypothetical protein [Opitutaceae bacterium]
MFATWVYGKLTESHKAIFSRDPLPHHFPIKLIYRQLVFSHIKPIGNELLLQSHTEYGLITLIAGRKMITDLNIALHASGDEYQPSKLDAVFTNANDPQEIATFGIHKGRPWGFGYSALVIPASVPLKDKIPTLCRAALPLIPKMKEAGASDIYVKAAFVCTDSCDVFLEAEELRLLATLGCYFSASCEIMTLEEEGDPVGTSQSEDVRS